MEKIGVSRFRENLLKFIKRVERGETIVITSRGREVALLVPPSDRMKAARKALDELRGQAVVGDIVSSAEVKK